MAEIIDDISDKIFLKKLKKEFEISIENSVNKLSELYDSGDFSEMSRIAHDIKGVAGIFGFHKGVELAAELLIATETCNKDKILEPYGALTRYMNKEVLGKRMEE